MVYNHNGGTVVSRFEKSIIDINHYADSTKITLSDRISALLYSVGQVLVSIFNPREVLKHKHFASTINNEIDTLKTTFFTDDPSCQ
jgi:hypothetical protein